jgi:predicted nucleic acid-binding protein
MIVLDASALGDWLLQTPERGPAVAERVVAARFLHTLDLAYLEVLSLLRRKVAARELKPGRADIAIDDLEAIPVRSHRAAPLTRRAWALRGPLTPYDAAYVALAEALGAPLITTDRRLARSRGHRAMIVQAGA